MTFLGYETTQWIAWLNLPELESSGKFLYTSSLATFFTLRTLLSIVKVGRVPDLRDFEMAVWSSRLADIAKPARRLGADSFITPPGTLCMHRKTEPCRGRSGFWLVNRNAQAGITHEPVPCPHPYPEPYKKCQLDAVTILMDSKTWIMYNS